MRLLDLFFENVVSIPFLRSDPALKAFLSLSNDKEWETARSSVEMSKDLVAETSLGCVKVRSQDLFISKAYFLNMCVCFFFQISLKKYLETILSTVD